MYLFLKRHFTTILLLCALATGLQSCFTGIESTPRIDYKENRRGGSRLSAEQLLAAEFTPEPVSRWRQGKLFYVASDRVSLVLQGSRKLSRGDILAYAGQSVRQSVTGSTATDILFVAADEPADTLVWRAPSADTPALPFMVDLDIVEHMRNLLVGNRYYVTTALWYSADGELVNGRKYVPVRITDVNPYSAEFPAIVTFEAETAGGGAETGRVMMSENRNNATRTFDSMFSTENPRRNFPQTTDQNWQAIQNSRTREGMTRAEVKAAIGSPAGIERGHNQSAAFERWNYSDGVTLMFVDGILSSEVM